MSAQCLCPCFLNGCFTLALDSYAALSLTCTQHLQISRPHSWQLAGLMKQETGDVKSYQLKQEPINTAVPDVERFKRCCFLKSPMTHRAPFILVKPHLRPPGRVCAAGCAAAATALRRPRGSSPRPAAAAERPRCAPPLARRAGPPPSRIHDPPPSPHCPSGPLSMGCPLWGPRGMLPAE